MPRDFTMEKDRIAWAIEHSGKSAMDVASAIGCSHATLSQWANGHTSIGNTKVRLITAFAAVTGTSLQWLLTGDGPAVATYRATEHPLVVAARHIAQEQPAQAEIAWRLLQALEQPPPTTAH